jgi:hypothetical protein
VWRDFAALSDVVSCDYYLMTTENNEAGRWGIWGYPYEIGRMVELSDGRKPVWGVIESTSQTPDQPTPDQVVRGTWAMLIAGARGITYFDHRFADGDVTQDFAAMLNDEPMGDAISALAALLQTLAPALHAPDAGLVTGWTSTGTLAEAKGGIAAGAPIPMHYTSRVAGGTNYVFAQSIRPGETTATLTIPSAAGEVLTVIGEARTVTADVSGVITDDFDDGDYTVRLYSWG